MAARVRHALAQALSLTIVVIAIAAIGPATGRAASLADIISRLKPSVVAIGTHQELRRPPDRFLGTGFAVGDGTVVATANHVVPLSLDTIHHEYLCVFVGTGDSAIIVKVAQVRTDPFHDSALLTLASGRLTPLSLGDDGKVREGNEVAFTGYPIGAVLGLYPVTHRGIVSARTPIAIPQSGPKPLDPRTIRELRHPFDVFQLDATAYPGNSGSPLYQRETGQVIGIVSDVFVKESKERLLSRPSGITFAIPIRYMRTLLDRQLGAR